MEIFHNNSGSPYFKFSPLEQKAFRLPDEVYVLGVEGVRQLVDGYIDPFPISPQDRIALELADILDSYFLEIKYG